MHRFEHDWILNFLWLIPAFFVWRIYLSYWSSKQLKVFSSALNRVAPERSPGKSWLKFILKMMALSALIIAAANPQRGGKVENQNIEGAQVIFALDLSKSMLVQDVQPDRLQRAKQLILRSINHLQNDQVGLIGFAGKAFPMVPLTPDKSSLLMQLRFADPEAISEPGTNFSAMLQLAATMFDFGLPSDRILVVLGDGEDHDGKWRDAVKALQELNIRIFCIGVGTEKGGLIPLMRRGALKEYLKDETGSPVVSRLESSTLQELADFGDGLYHYLGSLQKGEDFLKDVFAGVGRSEYERKTYTTYQSQYQWPLAFGIFLLLIEWLVFEKRTSWINKLQKLSEKKKLEG